MASILVTGAAGYIGSVVTEELVKGGHQVIALDNLEQGHRQAVVPEASFVPVDLAHKPALDQVFATYPIDAVMHLAAYSQVNEAMAHPAKYFANNVINGLNLLDSMLAHGVKKLIFSSSAAVYGEPQSLPIREEDPRQPTNPYGESKLVFENMLKWYQHAYGLKSISLRYFNAAGASQCCGESHHPETHLIPRIMKVALKQEGLLLVFGTDYDTKDGSCVRDYIHVRDVAQAHRLALEALDGGGGRCYNLGYGEGYTVLEVVAAAREITGAELLVEIRPRRPGDPAKLVASAELIRAELGWQPQFSDLKSMVASAWEWHRQHPHGYG